MKLEKEQIEKIVLGAVVAIIVIIVLVCLVFGPNIRRIGSLRTKIHEGKTKVLNAEEEVANLERIKLSLKQIEKQIKEYQAELPEATAYWLLGRLNQLAGDTGVDFDKIEPKGYTMQVGEYHLQELELELRTGYHKLGEFINQLERSSRFISIRNLSIVGNKEDVNRHNIKLTVGAFVGVPEEEKE